MGARITKDQEKEALRRFSESIQKDNLLAFLQDKEDLRFQTLFGMMVDPAYQRHSFYKLCRKAGISLLEISQIYVDGQRHLGLIQMMEDLPQIMKDVASDAKNATQPCPRCDAFGVLNYIKDEKREKRTCPLCHGAKEIKLSGDRHARELLFETAKLTHQGNLPLMVQTNVNIGDSRIEAMLKKTRSIILPDPPKEIANGNDLSGQSGAPGMDPGSAGR
jgi:hypothetical protein